MSDPNPLQDALNWAQTARPVVTEKQAQTALGVHFEEVSEMLASLRGGDRLTQSMLTAAMVSLHGLALHLKTAPSGSVLVADHTEHLDAICDQIVTATGVGQAFAYDIVGGMNEVNRSNFSKFEDGRPVFDENMKIIKGKNYSRAVLGPFTNR